MEKREDIKNVKVLKIIEQLCAKLHCSELAEDLERLNNAREMLVKLQQNEVKGQTLADDTTDEEGVHSLKECNEKQEEEDHKVSEMKYGNNLSNDNWLGFFKGYQILNEHQEFCLNSNKKCIEISAKDSKTSLYDYLRAGIRCFMIDLFKGTELEKQQLIFRLRESELEISQEYGFYVGASMFAMLSPRQQYTGMLEPGIDFIKLEKDDEITLTTKRIYSLRGNRQRIYVNARFIIEDCKLGDIILMGPTIQLSILEIFDEELKCLVIESGNLLSRLPVRFPGKYKSCVVSVEELEDITFANEVGINVLVSYIPGTPQYLDDLYDTMRLLKCENVRICTRIVLNQITGEDHELEWIANRYDGFLIDLTIFQQSDKCWDYHTAPKVTDVLTLFPAAVNLITKIYRMQKPIIFNPLLIIQQKLFVPPKYNTEIFYYPDKYIFSGENSQKSFYFDFLQNAISEDMSAPQLSLHPFCETLARSCVAASFESQAKAIVICSFSPDMAIKLSHFRPKIPIIFVSPIKSLSDHISMFYNIIFLEFRLFCDNYSYAEFITNSFIYGLKYLKARKFLEPNENVILVYATDMEATFLDKYLIYTFNDKHFAENLYNVLFN